MFGYKNHISIDRRYGFIRKAKTTSAADSDGRQLRDVIDTNNTASNVWAELSAAENVQREEMHPADMVAAFAEVREKDGLTAEAIGVRFGYSTSYVTKLLRLPKER